jgi:hypothetical protein
MTDKRMTAKIISKIVVVKNNGTLKYYAKIYHGARFWGGSYHKTREEAQSAIKTYKEERKKEIWI